MLTDDELTALLLDIESDLVEHKSSIANSSGIRKNICAFANDLPGHNRAGVIFIGVNPDGTCANLPITDELLQTLADMRSDGNILPPPTMVVEKRTLNDCELAIIIVHPSLFPPVRYRGRAIVKVGPTIRPATEEEERRLAERRRSADVPFDQQPVRDATLEDLDLTYFEREYLPAAIAPDILEGNRRPIEQQLASLRLLTPDGIPDYGAVIILGKNSLHWIPGTYINFLRIDGLNLTDPIRDQKELSGPLFNILQRLDELLEINITTAADITTSPVEIRNPDYPIVALQQLARNAVMHRSYEGTNAPVRIYWFNDRIEISNPGGLYGQVNEQNFGQGSTDYRNPLLAEAMKVLGYVQRFGLGIPLAKDELKKNGNPEAEFQFNPESVLVTVKSKR